MNTPTLTYTNKMSLASFCQITQQLPNELKQVIWKLSRETPFERWMRAINDILMETYQVEIGDLPDQPFVDYHEEGLEPQDVVNIMIEDEFIFM
jgi:hypothetical protein